MAKTLQDSIFVGNAIKYDHMLLEYTIHIHTRKKTEYTIHAILNSTRYYSHPMAEKTWGILVFNGTTRLPVPQPRTLRPSGQR